jgi:hypothetical protein
MNKSIHVEGFLLNVRGYLFSYITMGEGKERGTGVVMHNAIDETFGSNVLSEGFDDEVTFAAVKILHWMEGDKADQIVSFVPEVSCSHPFLVLD